MKRRSHVDSSRNSEGFALLFVLFLVALVLIGASTAVLSQLTEGRREREADMIWRGKQYERAIARYYRKFGRFPTSVDDLVKVQNGEERFLREAYKNPMNTEDGSWRFIYVTPSGQLIGSVQYTSLQQMALIDQQRKMGVMNGAGANGANAGDDSDNGTGTDAGAQNSASNPSLANILPGGINPDNLNLNNLSSSQLQSLQSQLQGLSPQQLQALAAQYQGQIPPQLQSQLQQFLQAQNSQQPGSSPSSSSGQAGAQPGANGGLSVDESSDTGASTDANGEVVGGFIVGVAGKENKPSIKFYKGGRTYKRWEFIFNPLEQTQTVGGLSSGPANVGAYGTCTSTNPCNSPAQPPQQQPQNPQQQ